MSTPGRPSDAPMRPLPRVIFFSRWRQLPRYLGLIDVAMISNLLVMVILHYAFLLSAVVMAFVNKMTNDSHAPVYATPQVLTHTSPH
ncbi:hypothetical protein [Pandoraea communis]|uniref:Membrane protein n=1 Tax=Pandoraea communis TaxID=2508297 RepID=A0A5E4Y035_9BURK|nr:membrane protein [Pandoraea communis]